MKLKKILVIFLIFIVFLNLIPIKAHSETKPSIIYQSHLKDYGWIFPVRDGQISGTTGQSRRLEAIKISINGLQNYNLTYRVHVKDYGWLFPVGEGQIAGTTGQSRRAEAIVINLQSDDYTLRYRVHVAHIGWMNWVNNGEIAGTTGKSLRMEAIEIQLIAKNPVNQTISQPVPQPNPQPEPQIVQQPQISQPVIPQEITNISQEENIQIVAPETNIPVTQPENTNGVKKGIDVSKFQGNINWVEVKNSGIEFAMIKCGSRGYTQGGLIEDEKFKTNVEQAYNAGLKVGIYFYSSALNDQEAIEEANFVLNLINKYSLHNKITFPIAFDFENDFLEARNYNLTVQESTNICKTFCNYIKNNGYKPMIYSHHYFLENRLDMDNLQEFDTWLAHYIEKSNYPKKYTIWQYTSKGRISGINGDVDLNYCYTNY